MYKILYFKDADGMIPVKDYINQLASKKGKDSRIKLKKIHEYLQILSCYGLTAGEPYIKHLDGDIWELRPLRDRILFVGAEQDSFVLLHHFMKRTRKTPVREIEKAKRELEYLRRSNYEF